MFLSFICNGYNKPLRITIVRASSLSHGIILLHNPNVFSNWSSSSLSQQPQEQDKQIMVSSQCEVEASNQSIACEVEAIPIEHDIFR